MSSQNIISCCNIALLNIGTRSQISSLDENSPESNACSTLYAFVFEQLARAAYWNCLRQQVPLTLLKAAAGTPENPQGTTLPLPPYPWSYAYQQPNDCLMSRFITPSPCVSSTGVPISPAMRIPSLSIPLRQIPFIVTYGTDNNGNPLNLILTNLRAAQLVYTVNQPNPSVWDSSFTAGFIAALSAHLAPALTLNMALMAAQVQIAERIIAEARIRDANEGSNTQDHIPDWQRARGGYGFGNGGECGGGYNNYSDMAWPSMMAGSP